MVEIEIIDLIIEEIIINKITVEDLIKVEMITEVIIIKIIDDLIIEVIIISKITVEDLITEVIITNKITMMIDIIEIIINMIVKEILEILVIITDQQDKKQDLQKGLHQVMKMDFGIIVGMQWNCKRKLTQRRNAVDTFWMILSDVKTKPKKLKNENLNHLVQKQMS